MSTLGLLALTLGPGLFVLGWIYIKDKYEKEPLSLLLFAFLAGAVSALQVLHASEWWVRQGFGVSPTNVIATAFYAFVSVGATEEIFKLLVVLIFLFPRKEFNEPFDGIVYCTAVAMGFATAENLLYVYVNSDPSEATWIALMRMFTAVPAHATFAILMGFFIGHAKFNSYRKMYIGLGFLTASLMHGAYDFFLFIQNIPGMSIGAALSLVIGVRYARKAIAYNQLVSPFNPHEPE
ncbi:MAG: PrsW family intramembrane metalloprotease [Bacteroidetes bacterium]|nr:PrsW family intramembrane metalloprotease [Bacteroidota bacterium]